MRLGKAKIAKTSIIDNDLNPKWNESYRIEVCHFAVRDKDHAYSEYIGAVDYMITNSSQPSKNIGAMLWKFPTFRSTKLEESRSGNDEDLSAFNESQSFSNGKDGQITGESFKSDLNNTSANNIMSTEPSGTQGQDELCSG